MQNKQAAKAVNKGAIMTKRYDKLTMLTLALIFVFLTSCGDVAGFLGIIDPYENIPAGLYSGDPLNGGTSVGVAANDVAAAVAYVNATPGSSYTLVLDSDAPVTASQALTSNNLTIVGARGVRTITLMGGSSALFTVSGSSSRLTLDNNITLKGNNINSVVSVVGYGSTFYMNSGSKITDNIITANGGGVLVNGGTFTMTGGTISGNRTTTGFGGGVCVNGGTFTMAGGTISNNTATAGFGGGVCVNGGAFNKTGGTIYGKDAGYNSNTATDGKGHAAYDFSGSKYRDTTAAAGVLLNSSSTANWGL